MKRLVLVLAFASGCAVCHIRPDNTFSGAAVGHAYCERWPDGHARVEGGALSNNFVELFSTAVTALGAYFGGGAL
jgi:hypothetical protein